MSRSISTEIVHAARGAADLTQRLLVLGRQRVSRPEPVPLSAFVDRLRDAVRRLLPDDVSVILHAPADRLTAYVDEGELQRAVLNLVLNARDAMPRGGTLTIGWRGKVVAGHERELSDGRYIALSVGDDGDGMDRETLACIFDPFFTTKGDRGGTGLGLATVYAFAKDSGGSVTVTSNPAQGTTFTLFLPEHTRDSEPAPDPPSPPAVVRPRPVQGCILVVEDRADVRGTMTRILSQDGLDVREAADGDGALRILSDHTNVALMCIDGIMPGMSTAAVIERALELSPSMAVLVCSGYVQEELLRRGIATGRYAFLSKPFTAQELLASVHRALEPDASGHASG